MAIFGVRVIEYCAGCPGRRDLSHGTEASRAFAAHLHPDPCTSAEADAHRANASGRSCPPGTDRSALLRKRPSAKASAVRRAKPIAAMPAARRAAIGLARRTAEAFAEDPDAI